MTETTGVLFFTVMQFALQSTLIKGNVVEFNILFCKNDELVGSGMGHPICITVWLMYDFDLFC